MRQRSFTAEAGEYAAVILAAGMSSRMKAFKPLLDIGGRPALIYLEETVKAAGVEDIIVVTGHGAELLREELAARHLTEAYNSGYRSGMFSSIRTGLSEALKRWPEKKGFLLMPADCPLIAAETIRALISAARSEEDGEGRFFVPVYEGKKGHPLLIPSGRAEQIISHDPDGSLKEITDRCPDQMVRVPVRDEGCVMDMDSPETYQDLLDFLAGGMKRPDPAALAEGRRIIFVRHGQTARHDEPVFIGQYDVPLSEEGREQARAAGKKLAALAAQGEILRPERIYSSLLSRAAETAEIIADVLADPAEWEGCAQAGRKETSAGRPEIIRLRELNEISLGEWDGRPVREIRERFPEEYDRRGRELFSFKTGNRAESFFDMQYRAVGALRRILEGDPARDILIAAHSGVIRALENNLRGMRVDDEWIPLEKGGVRII